MAAVSPLLLIYINQEEDNKMGRSSKNSYLY